MKWLGDRSPIFRKCRQPSSLGFWVSRHIINAKAGDPIAERCAIRRIDVLGQVGSVGMKHVRKLLYGQAGLTKPSASIRPLIFPAISMVKRRCCLPLCLFRLMIKLTVIFRSHLRYHRVFHLLVKQQIVLEDNSRDRRKTESMTESIYKHIHQARK